MPMPRGARRGSINPCEFTAHFKVEEYPDVSHLGEYSDKLKPGGIDLRERGDWSPGTYKYFNVGTGDPAYIEQDYKRMRRFDRGDWHMMGIWVEATATARNEDGEWVTKEFKSGGIWGVESDSDYDYLQELIAEELSDIENQLAAEGIKCSIPASENVEIVRER